MNIETLVNAGLVFLSQIGLGEFSFYILLFGTWLLFTSPLWLLLWSNDKEAAIGREEPIGPREVFDSRWIVFDTKDGQQEVVRL